jgi:hypothetical protein
VVFADDDFSLIVSPNLTKFDFLCESSSPISTIGTPDSLAGSSTMPTCQPAPVVPPEFEPHAALVPVPYTHHPGALRAPKHQSWRSDQLPDQSDRPPGSQTSPYTKPGGPTAPYSKAGSPTSPFIASGVAEVADRLCLLTTTTFGTIIRDSSTHDSTSLSYHGRTRDTSGEPSPDDHTGQRQLPATTPLTLQSDIPSSIHAALTDPN